MKNKKIIIIFFIIFLTYFIFNFFSIINLDVIWNYGFSLNFSKGLLMYKDYNMVITPLYPFIVGLLMKILGNNLIIFYMINALFCTLIIFVISKLNKKIIIPFAIMILLTSEPNYDLLSTLFLFLLIFLEKNKKSNYLIGIILGLTFLTKSSVGVFLALPTIIYLNNFKVIFKRFIGFLIPNILFIIYFLIKGTLYDYINYAFLGLFNFASGNGSFNILTLLTVLIIAFFIYKYVKEKNIENLYIASFQIVNYPLFNISHFIESLIPVVYYILNKFDNYAKYYKYSAILAIIPFFMLIYNIKINHCNYTNYPFNTKYIQQEYIDDINSLKEYFNNDFENVHFIMYESYLYNIMLNKNPDIFSLSLKGNLGYKGEDNFIKKLNSLEKNSIIITSCVFQEGQSSELIYNHIKSNYSLVAQFRKFSVYTIN